MPNPYTPNTASASLELTKGLTDLPPEILVEILKYSGSTQTLFAASAACKKLREAAYASVLLKQFGLVDLSKEPINKTQIALGTVANSNISPDGRLIVISDQAPQSDCIRFDGGYGRYEGSLIQSITVRNENGDLLQTFDVTAFPYSYQSLHISPDNKFIVAFRDLSVIDVFNIETGIKLHTLPIKNAVPCYLHTSEQCFIGQSAGIGIWDITKPVAERKGDIDLRHHVGPALFFPDSNQLIYSHIWLGFSDTATVSSFNLVTKQERQLTGLPIYRFIHMAKCPNSEKIALLGVRDGTLTKSITSACIVIYNLKTATLENTFTLDPTVASLPGRFAISRNGAHIAILDRFNNKLGISVYSLKDKDYRLVNTIACDPETKKVFFTANNKLITFSPTQMTMHVFPALSLSSRAASSTTGQLSSVDEAMTAPSRKRSAEEVATETAPSRKRPASP
jgi:hypothetical protein